MIKQFVAIRLSKNESKRCPERKISKRCLERCHLMFKYPYGQKYIEQVLSSRQAITHRFVHGEKGWYLNSSIDILKREAVTEKPQGIG